MRRILPTSVSSRCGFIRRMSFCSPEPASPDPRYMTRQSASPRRATGLKVNSPSGWMGCGCCRRNNSRAVPSNVAFAGFRSVHSMSTTSRSIRVTAGVEIAGVVVYPDRSRPATAPPPRRHLLVDGRVFHVEGVEHSVTCVVGIEAEVDETRGEIALEREFPEEPRAPAGAVEVQVGRERLRLLVDDVERAVEVVDEEAAAPRLVAQEVHPGQLPPRVLPIELAGNGHRRKVCQFERQTRGRLRRKDLPGREGQGKKDLPLKEHHQGYPEGVVSTIHK